MVQGRVELARHISLNVLLSQHLHCAPGARVCDAVHDLSVDAIAASSARTVDLISPTRLSTLEPSA